MTLTQSTRDRIEHILAEHPVVLFMKGSRMQPQCGFSATVVGILDRMLPDYHTVDVLADLEIREGVKVYSEWPTIPQLYVRGEFLGGCDLVQQMYRSGDLHTELGVTANAENVPEIRISDAAARVLTEAISQHQDGVIQLVIGANWQHEFRLAEGSSSGVRVTANGIELLFDAESAARANGLSIDLSEASGEPEFIIENPNSPQAVRQMTVQELKQSQDAGDALHLYDVREAAEREIAVLPGAKHLTEEVIAEIDALPRDALLVFHCHSGVRSQAAAEYFARQGFSNVRNLAGGIDAWSREIDPEVARY